LSPRTLETEESTYGQGCDSGVKQRSAGLAPADDAVAVRGGGPAGDGSVVGVRGVPAGAGGAGVPAARPQAGGAVAEGIAVALGEKLGGAGPEAFAAEGGAAVARTVERGLPGPARERFGFWATRNRENPWAVRGGPGAGPVGPAAVVHEVRAVGAGAIEGQARSDSQEVFEAISEVGGLNYRRLGLCATKPGGNGGIVYALGGALRTRQCAGDEQLAVLEVGANLQRPDDDGGGDRSAGTPQRDRGGERAELPSGGGQKGQASRFVSGIACRGKVVPGWGPGSATVAVAALRLPPLRQAPTPESFAGFQWGMIIVAQGER